MHRVHLIISGDVQGVGFRSWTKQRAGNKHITGWVKNREDGSVEILAEGSKEALETFISDCRRGPEVSWVKHIDVQRSEGKSEFVGFEVIY